jgi:hypothetical protein
MGDSDLASNFGQRRNDLAGAIAQKPTAPNADHASGVGLRQDWGITLDAIADVVFYRGKVQWITLHFVL